MYLKGLVLAAAAAVYLYGALLDILRMRSARNAIPANVSDVYDKETYMKWRAYHAEKTRFSAASSAVAFAADFALLAFDAYAAFASLFPRGDLFLQMFAVLLLSALSSLVMLPFSRYETMTIEGKYGFNRATEKTFWADRAKEFAIGLALTVAVGGILMALHSALGDRMVLAFAAVMTLLMLGIAFLFPFLGRIFNRFTPLGDGELKDRLRALLEKNGYKVRAIDVMDASRRTTKANAYFSGFGKTKTIVLYDTLVDTMTADEICAVFAHEMGHALHRDTLKNQILTFLEMLALAALAWLTLRTEALFLSFGFGAVNYGFAVVVITSVEFALLSPLFALAANAVSRRAEYRADACAVREGYGKDLVSALKKLSRQNLSDLAPSPLLVKLEYSHPTLSRRIAAIEKLQGL